LANSGFKIGTFAAGFIKSHQSLEILRRYGTAISFGGQILENFAGAARFIGWAGGPAAENSSAAGCVGNAGHIERPANRESFQMGKHCDAIAVTLFGIRERLLD